VERRLALAGDELQRARCRLHHNHEAVRAAEEALMACRLAWEEAALRVAELADIVESLQRDLDGPDGVGGPRARGEATPSGILALPAEETSVNCDYVLSGAGCAGSR
jgi:hypothetical protein